METVQKTKGGRECVTKAVVVVMIKPQLDRKNSFWVHSTLKLLDSPKREKNREKRWF